jgi:aminopeptidase N
VLHRNEGEFGPLELDGVGLQLERIAQDGETLPARCYELVGDVLRIFDLPQNCTISTTTVLDPTANKGDEGLFELHGKLATQCESEGFRRITWFPDRPDVLCIYSVTLVGDPGSFPVMLSNGNPVAEGMLDDGRRWIRWDDPFPKSSYIFAIVAGDFGCFSGQMKTASGREVVLNIYADHERIGECGFAMDALKRSLVWEEEKYGREYDLDVYNIVALTGHVGAMENKGLNVFDANGICADPEISTDQDYLIIERILAHEVFHNWTGNRVTCRDWFQLSLKEGLTRFRDQCFSQEMSGAGVKRIEFVKALQRNQFPEDDGPAAHPVKPLEYIEIRNFYTGTVYDKGAEVIRMLHSLLGDQLFREGVKLYLERHDLQAVTTEDFVKAIEDVSGRDLSQFYRWYEQAGRPRLSAKGQYDAMAQTYRLEVTQHTRPIAGQEAGKPFHIPLVAGLLSQSGEPIVCDCDDASQVDGNLLLELTEEQQAFSFRNVSDQPIPSLLRGFSAPVSLETDLSEQQLATLWACDTDPFNRWQSGQNLGIKLIRALAEDWHAGRDLGVNDDYAKTWARLLVDRDCEPGLLAELLLLPDEPALSEGLSLIDIDGHLAARDFLLQKLATGNRSELLKRYHDLADQSSYEFSAQAMGRRSLRNRILEILLTRPDMEVLSLCLDQIRHGGDMTDKFSALAALCHVPGEQRQQGLDEFYQRWQHKDSVVDKWFNAQALSRMPGAIDAILALEQHPAMDLMNMPRAMAFYGGFFRQNRVGFNDVSGRGYDMLADRLIMVDAFKPGNTYWLMPQILQWRRFDKTRQQLMRNALEKVLAADISKGLYETVSKALAQETV